MIKLLSKFDRYDSPYPENNYNFIVSFLLQRIDDIQSYPEKYSEKDFETINRMVKQIYDYYTKSVENIRNESDPRNI